MVQVPRPAALPVPREAANKGTRSDTKDEAVLLGRSDVKHGEGEAYLVQKLEFRRALLGARGCLFGWHSGCVLVQGATECPSRHATDPKASA